MRQHMKKAFNVISIQIGLISYRTIPTNSTGVVDDLIDIYNYKHPVVFSKSKI